jgi:hypothetical protein
MTTFMPLNSLEVALVQAQDGILPVQKLLQILVESDLAMPSATEVIEDGSGFQPLLFPKGEAQMLACFSDKSRIGEFSSLAPYCLVINGRDVLRRMPLGYGLVINPGAATGFDISPDGIAKIIEDFA